MSAAAPRASIIVGRPDDVARVVDELRRQYRVGYRAIGATFAGSARTRRTQAIDLPTVDFAELAATSKRTRTRAVIVAGDLPGGSAAIRRLGWELENTNTELILVSRLTDVAGPRIHLRPINGLPMVHVDLPQYSGFNHAVKRSFDIALAAVALLLLSPLMAAIAVGVRLSGDGPVLFRQERVGAHGTRFTMLKFRSMVTDAEARLLELQDRNEGSGVLFKVKDDPRVTPFGRALRRYSLDELPQLWNVLAGSMSLVGPRPPLPNEVERYEEDVNRRLLTKPGITGLWQVSGRSNLSWDESVKIDLYYVENWSITGDLVILTEDRESRGREPRRLLSSPAGAPIGGIAWPDSSCRSGSSSPAVPSRCSRACAPPSRRPASPASGTTMPNDSRPMPSMNRGSRARRCAAGRRSPSR